MILFVIVLLIYGGAIFFALYCYHDSLKTLREIRKMEKECRELYEDALKKIKKIK